MNNSNIHRRQQAFSLLEVLIALSIMVVAFTTLLATQNGHLLLSNRGEQVTKAVFLARQKLGDLEILYRATPLPLNDFEESAPPKDKPFGDDFPEFGYELSIRKVDIPIPTDLGTGDGAEETENAISGSASAISDIISDALREVRLTVMWETALGSDKIEIVTHLVDLNANIGIQ